MRSPAWQVSTISLEDRVDREDVAAPVDHQQIEIVDRRAVRQVSIDGGGCRLRAGETAIAFGAPVSELCERPRHAERVALGRAHGGPVGLAIHADG
ncbi:MAG: hypothetical protein DMF84_27895 [Acidobacteria bacterium]|nr:MAG: hypothetical protein DMF84_27895 [Acidobacteriota bacterium]